MRVLVFVIFSFMFCLDSIDKYIDQVLIGDISDAVIKLPNYEKQYPNNPAVIFLSGLLDIDGESAKKKFAYISNDHKASKYSVDSIIKVAEYYYTAGLYMQSADWLKKIPQYHPGSKELEKSINLFMNSMTVAGNTDSAAYYSKVFEKQFPNVEIEQIALQKKDAYSNKPIVNNEAPVVDNDKAVEVKRVDSPKKNKNIIVKIQDLLDRVRDDLMAPINEYSLQVGAFGKRTNAEQQQKILLDSGYDTRIESVNSNGILLYTVRVGYFSDRSAAKEEQRRINSGLGMSPVIIKNE